MRTAGGIEWERLGDGPGPALLLVPGMGALRSTWGELLPLLAERRRCLVFDPPGLGASAPCGEGFTLHGYAAGLAALLREAGETPAVAVGHAYGGRVAQLLAAEHPAVVRALVVLGNGAIFPPAPDTVKRFLGLGDRGLSREAFRASFLELLCGPRFAAEDPVRAEALVEQEWRERQSRGTTRPHRKAVTETPVLDYWGRARCPTLLVYGTEDRFGTRENALDLQARLPGSRLVWLEGAGHYLTRERPAAVAQAILDFTDGLASAGG